MNPLRTDGHLHDLALEDLLDDAAPPEARAHLAGCGACRARLAAAHAVSPGAAPAPANDHRGWFAAAALVACALALGTLARPPADDGLAVRGAGVQLRLYLDQGGSSRRLRDGDPIAPGDRIGFSVDHPAGYLLIVGTDAGGAPYLCYPQGGGGAAVQVEASDAPHPLPEAIRMDATPGAERLTAVVCDHPFTLDQWTADPTAPGCAQSAVTVVKP